MVFPSGEAAATTRYYGSGYFDGPIPACCPPFGKTSWISVQNHAFSVLLPPGWVYEPLQGIDSFVGRYHGDGMELVFDYGRYTNFESFGGEPPFEGHKETIGGVDALLVQDASSARITGAHFDETGGFGSAGVRLTIVGHDLAPEQHAIALQIFRSVRFAE
jgi:hypothetical protein